MGMINKKLLTAAAFIALTSSACVAQDLGNFSVGIEGSHLWNLGEKEKDSLAYQINEKIKDKKNSLNTFRASLYVQGYVMEDLYLGIRGNYNMALALKEKQNVDLQGRGGSVEVEKNGLYNPRFGAQAFVG